MPLQDLTNIWVIVSYYATRKEERGGEKLSLRIEGKIARENRFVFPHLHTVNDH